MTDQTTDQTAPLREQLLDALDFSYCQGLGYATPEELLTAYDASRAPGDWDALVREADQLRRDGAALHARAEGIDRQLAALRQQVAAPVDRAAALSETERRMLEYALDLADEEIATDGSDFTDDEEDALAELRRIVTKPTDTGGFELRGDTEIRAAALREAADRVDNEELPSDYVDMFDNGARWAAKLLRRMADETATTETQAHPPLHQWRVEILDGDEWMPASGLRRDRSQAAEQLRMSSERRPLWNDGTGVQRRLVRETTTYTVEDETGPATGARQDGAQ
ncbi:hypothetical protein [Streptomyces sp. NPDC057336]|uniref:hypothetical protein n=1 Tax=Streptomyces sp. NPDC057336 TaxID=3346102 RepID=UPI0036371E97